MEKIWLHGTFTKDGEGHEDDEDGEGDGDKKEGEQCQTYF